MSFSFTTRRLDDIAVIDAGDPAPQKADDFASDGMPFVRMQDVGKYRHTTSLVETRDHVSPDTSARLKTFAAGSILIPKSGASIRLNHRAMLGIDAHVVSHLAVIQVRPGVNPKFVYYWLCGIDMTKVAHDAHMPSLKLSDLGALTIPVPPLGEQERIVAILDAADELQKLRQQADRRTADLIPAIFHDMFGDPATNPNGFEKAKLGDIIRLKSGEFLPQKSMEEGPYPVYGGNGINGYHSAFLFEQPQIVIGRVGYYCGNVFGSQARSWITDNALYVAEKDTRLEQEYLIGALKAARLNQYASRAAQPLISGSRVYPVSVLVPPVPLQKKYAERVVELRNMEVKQAETRRRLDDLFQSLLHRAFEGEL